MDLFIGRNAHRDVTPLIMEELKKRDGMTETGAVRATG